MVVRMADTTVCDQPRSPCASGHAQRVAYGRHPVCATIVPTVAQGQRTGRFGRVRTTAIVCAVVRGARSLEPHPRAVATIKILPPACGTARGRAWVPVDTPYPHTGVDAWCNASFGYF
jgi:hypothetical protein